MSKKKKGPHYTRKEVERAMLARMAKNGITAEDLDKFSKRGYRDGSHEALQQAAPTTYKTLFAAMAIVGKARR